MKSRSATRDSLQWSSSNIVAILLYHTLVFSMLQLQMPARADAALNCTDIVGEYRDCTCGIKYRDVERRCQDEHTYYQPILSQQNLSCDFTCLNGGSYDQSNERCNCWTPQNPIATSHGMCCEVPSRFCGAIHLKPTGEIMSLGFSQNVSYLPNLDCVWRISTDKNRRIALGVVENNFDIEEGTSIFSCNRDNLKVYDGENDQAHQLGNFCGNAFGLRAFRTVYSSGRHLYLKFKTDGSNERKGFHLRYQTFLNGSRYGRTTFSLPTGLITSPQYPLNYRPGESCDYKIRVKPGHDLILRTQDINIPSQNSLCTDWREDRIQVLMKRAGAKIYTNVTSFCGQGLYPKLAIKGASSVMLKFRSNNVREGRFLLQYDHSPASDSLK